MDDNTQFLIIYNIVHNLAMYYVCQCNIFIAVKYERIKFLVVALRDGIEIYAWAPKPYHKFMAFKVWFYKC